MKFAIAIAALFASTNAMKVMSVAEISSMEFEDQVALINAVKSESTSLREKIGQLKTQNAQDVADMQNHITQCNDELGTKEGELDTLQGSTWTNLVQGHINELASHKSGLAGELNAEQIRLEGLLQDEKDTLVDEVKDTADALKDKEAADTRLEAANAEKTRLENEQTDAIAALDSAQGAVYQPIEDDRIEKSAEEEELKLTKSTNEGTISQKTTEHGQKTTNAANKQTDIDNLIRDQDAALKAHNGIIDPINKEIEDENTRHEAEELRLQGIYDKMVEDRAAADPIAISDEVTRLTQVRDDAVTDATKMDENTIYEVCTKIDEEGDGSLPVTINTVNSDDSEVATV